MFTYADRRRKAVVLFAENNPAEQELARRALADGVIECDFRVVSDGQEAWDYLRGRNRYAGPKQAPRPDLILLDLNMPRIDGREVLRELKADSALATIPVIVLTNSRQDEDVSRSYELGCNSFINKPVEIEDFMDAVRTLSLYWFQLVMLPPHKY